MKIAFVHCRIANWGALNVLKDIIEQQTYTSTKIFTLYSDRDFLQIGPGENNKIEIITALPKKVNQMFRYFSTHKIKILSSILDYRNLMFFYPVLMKILSRKIKKYSAKKIIISSFAIAKNITIPSWIPNILYLHSPMQYIRSHHQEYLKKLTGYKKKLFQLITKRTRKRDKKFIQFDKIICNSKYTAKLCKEIYNIEATAISYPKVNEKYLNVESSEQKQAYYVYIGRLVNFVKECDKIIKLFNKNWLPLLMIGSGPDEYYLKSIAKENIIFLGWMQDQQEIIKILKNAKGMINITKESFWLWTAESLLCWTPVLWFKDCASEELIDEKSGILTEKKDYKSIASAFEKFATTSRDSQTIQNIIKEKLEKYPFKIN